MKYPTIMSEDLTIDAAAKHSLSRWGDGEWRCTVGGGCTSQRPDPKLARELQLILLHPTNDLIVALPNPFNGCPRRESWVRYSEDKYIKYCGAKTYGSSFVTRPDNAPWIDRPDYWEKIRDLWRGQEIVLVSGDKKSITTEMIGSEANVREVQGPRQHAYGELGRIEEEIGKTSARVLICLGTAATVLAARLSRKGIHAIDLGHIGMFMKHAGAYRYGADDLTTPTYRAQLMQLHRDKRWGADGAKHTEAVRQLHAQFQPKTTLDYGCGENKLAESLAGEFRVSGYDPGIPERAKMPKPCDMVVCTDVLEHVEPSKLDSVLDHIWRVTGRVGYFVIDLRPANAILPDGRNAHLSLHPGEWWHRKFCEIGWLTNIEDMTETSKSLSFVAEKPQ